ncbi:MAG: ScpA family protein [Candidatus Micrarchaeaceae archaeon]|jgi:segregation and condensation protein A|nr:segregation/condensation protein A [Candidatus Micrarchaeota archaeon]HII09938.1 segregation/condensation protein A [Candidatus Micrarchaeota archaeon]
MTSGTDAIPQSKQQLNLQEFVKNATWRELLVELVDSNQLDPWNIDIVKVVDSYIAVVRKMQVMDLHIPANIVLAASILLRMKSETINIFPVEEAAYAEEGPELQEGRILPEVPPLISKLRLQPKRKITLEELMNALGDAIKINEKRERVVIERAAPLNFVVEKDDIDEKMNRAYKLVKANADREGMTTFGHLAKGFDSIENILLGLFVPLLFLAHNRQLTLMQDEFFKEIFVKLSDEDGKPVK